ncbi:MAG: ABC transporter ATP-binding protein [Anaerolineae bacterium]|nr:ABC transporter ATP-binding protein [Anaerolineae bacterium]
MHVYEIINLTKRYPGQTVPANDDLTFTVERGEVFGLLGANGAGKTTLVKQMANLLSPTQGTIRLLGKPLTSEPLYAARHVGYMPQQGEALNTLTVGETLYFTAHLRGMLRRPALAERDRLIARLGMEAIRRRPVNKLSGGQKRLVLLATAMAAQPPVLILDEPSNDLDPQYRRLVWDEVQALNRQHGTTVILVTHNLLEAERVVGRVGIMWHGRLLATGRPGQLKGALKQQLNLDLMFAPEHPPSLPNGATPREVAPGHWHLLIDQEAAPAYLAAIVRDPSVEDFHLSTATLEDLYLALAAAPQQPEPPAQE